MVPGARGTRATVRVMGLSLNGSRSIENALRVVECATELLWRSMMRGENLYGSQQKVMTTAGKKEFDRIFKRGGSREEKKDKNKR